MRDGRHAHLKAVIGSVGKETCSNVERIRGFSWNLPINSDRGRKACYEIVGQGMCADRVDRATQYRWRRRVY